MHTVTAVSAPGKVLFTGGFLVLDRTYTGLVFGLDARIHVCVQRLSKTTKSDGESATGITNVLVESPQFYDARWLYRLAASDRKGAALATQQQTDQPGVSQTSNKFVAVTLQYVLTYLSTGGCDVSGDLKITILADRSYYSQSEHEQAADRFAHFGVKLSEAHKTGLGSSAALVTALTASLLKFFAASGKQQLDTARVHNLAQAAHCAAQGKIGSGFDVAAAVYGSCLYRRFSPAILETVGEVDAEQFSTNLQSCINDTNADHKWDTEIKHNAVQIPEDVALVMCDVDCGSETPSLVRGILSWRKQNQSAADEIWQGIQKLSESLCDALRRPGPQDSDDPAPERRNDVRDIIVKIRSLVREMTSQSGVPVEPPVITQLLDYCSELPGVLGGVAPGAGGYDAVALLIKNDSEVERDLKDRLLHFQTRETDTGVTIGRVRLLDVKQAFSGLEIESPEDYKDCL